MPAALNYGNWIRKKILLGLGLGLGTRSCRTLRPYGQAEEVFHAR